MKTDTLKFHLKGGLNDEGWIDGDGMEGSGRKLENLVSLLIKISYILLLRLGEMENKTRKPNSNILNDFYDFSLSLHFSMSLLLTPLFIFYTF